MDKINVHDAKTQMAKLLERVERGEEIIIARAGRPAAMLVPLASRRGRRKLGALDGRFDIPDDFNTPLPAALLKAFSGVR